jgi:hypothetical protein
MNTTNSKTDPAAAEQFARNFEADFKPADAARTEALQQLQVFRTAKASHLKRQRLRLVDLLGEDDSRVQEIGALVASNNELSRAVGVEIDRAKAATLEPNAEGWIVHGYVRGPDGEGQSKLTLVACDRNGGWVRELGYTCTDSSGYFKLDYAGPGRKQDDPQATDKSRPELFLRVSDQQQKVLLTDHLPLEVRLGHVEYRELYLSEGAASCPPPPEQKSEDFPEKDDAPQVTKTARKSSKKKASKKENG